jgi:hypothetical protein
MEKVIAIGRAVSLYASEGVTMIYLRTVEDASGDVIEYRWYHSQPCYAESFNDPKNETIESGGAYPCGAESDTLDYCAHCGCIVGNPLTDYGTAELPGIVTELLKRGDDDSIARANEIVSEYGYAIPPDVKEAVTRVTMRDYMERGYE